MKYGFEVPCTGQLAGPDALTRIGRRAEELGFDVINAGDHIVIPREIGSVYPYSDSGEFVGEWAQGESLTGNFLEQLTVLGFLAGQTTDIRLLTGVLVVPYRSPVHTAKMLATIDVLSKGRLIVGCGAGWMREEFVALETPPYTERGAVTDEYIAAFKELWTSPSPSFEGKYCAFSDVAFEPKPVQRPHPPIWIGGESPPAERRAARVADVWYPFGNNPRFPLDSLESLAAAIQRVRGRAADYGRVPSEIGVAYSAEMWYNDRRAELTSTGERRPFTGSPEQIAGDIRAYEGIGVQYLMLNFQGDTVEESEERMERFATEVSPLAAY